MSLEFECEKDNEKKVFSAIKNVLLKTEISHKLFEDRPGFMLIFKEDEEQSLNAEVYILKDLERIMFSIHIIRLEKINILDDVIDFVSRVNYGLTIGNFEFDYDTNYVKYKISIDFSGSVLPEIMIRNIFINTADVLEDYEDALISVVKGIYSPLEAIERAENRDGFNFYRD